MQTEETTIPTDAKPGFSGGSCTLPASFAQERLWFLHRLDPQSPNYNIPAVFRVSGQLDCELLRRCINEIAARHEALRTYFAEEDGRLVQVIHDELRVHFQIEDLAATPETERDNRARSLVDEFIHQPFNLSHEPLMRVLLVRFSSELHWLVLNIHHSIFDGASLAILLRELADIYAARSAGRDPALPLPALQYGDFAAWQRDSFDAGALAGQVEFWRQRLTDPPDPHTLPECQHDGADESEGALLLFTVDKSVLAPFRRLCQREDVTLFMGLMACAKVLLCRYSRQDHVIVGMPVTNRPRPELAKTVGLFVNTTAVRADLSGSPNASRLLAQVRSEVLDAFANADLPFEKAVELAGRRPRDGRNPLFCAMLALQERLHEVPLANAMLQQMPVEFRAAKADLLFEFTDCGDSLTAALSYPRLLFTQDTIARLGQHFTMLMQAMAASPEQSVQRLPMLTSTEINQLDDWTSTVRSLPEGRTVESLFREQTRRTPEGAAVVDGDTSLSYLQLDTASDAVASRLIKRGTPSGSLIAVPAERSARFVVAALGVLKAGCVYVPIDPGEPGGRAEAMRDICNFSMELEQPAGSLEMPPPHTQRTSSDAACVMFTSGTTGKPKGVLVPHSGIVRLVVNNDYAPFHPDDAVAFASNVCFDAATFEIWGALLNGATLVVTPRDTLLSPDALSRHIARHRISVMFLTTSLFNRLAHDAPAMFAPLRILVFGGEAADAASVSLVLQHGKPGRLVNGYGPTETTTFAVCHTIEKLDGMAVPIGRPIANTRVFILDRAMQRVPPGVAGEIFIGGPGVALGYHGEPELTAEKFVMTEFGRLYRTGDLARWLDNGTIEYLGRLDAQVKLRGFRIEPAEIEQALHRHPRVKQAAVVAQTENGRAQSLTAYLVAADAGTAGDEDIRRHLSEHLPQHMIPSAFVWMKSLPLTANGKLDSRRLPEPSRSHAAAPLPPRTDDERLVAEIWSRVLRRPAESIREDFFTSGGHSLLALRMLTEIRRATGVEIPARRLFATPTIEGLASCLKQHASMPAPAGKFLVQVQHGAPGRRPLFLVPGGWGGEIEFLVYADLSRRIDPNLPVWGLKARGAGTDDGPHATVKEMAADYIAELRLKQPQGPYLIAGECIGGIVAHEIACQLKEAGEDVALLVLMDTVVPDQSLLKSYLETEEQKRAEEARQFSLGQRIRTHIGQVSALPWRGKLRYIFSKSARRESSNAASGAPVVEQHPRGQKEYPATLLRHKPRPYAGKITLIVDEESEAWKPRLGWDGIHEGALETHLLPGTHLSYIREYANTAANKLREIIHNCHANRHPAASAN